MSSSPQHDSGPSNALRFAALGTLLLGLVLAVVSPRGVPLDAGWITPVLAFEFATVPSDVAFLRDPDVRDALALGQRLDMVFPIFYGALLFFTARVRGDRLAQVFAALAIPADLWENLVMDGVSAAVASDADVQAALTWLPTATWTKWFLIAAALVGLAISDTSLPVRVLFAVTAVVAVLAFATGAPVLCEALGGGVLVSFGVLMVRAARNSEV